MKTTFKQDKAQAGLTILLSLVVMLFIIGLIVMIFTLMGSELKIATYTTTTTAVVNETVASVTEAGVDFATVSYRDVVCTLVLVNNATGGESITSTNYTQTNCNIASTVAGVGYNDTDWNVTYSYTYEADNTATDTMNDTTSAVATVTDWFDIFVVIGAMVVLILLTVIIITAIRSSGMVAGGETRGANTVGTA